MVPGAACREGRRLTRPCQLQLGSIAPWYRLAVNSGAPATVGGLCHAAERPVRWTAWRMQSHAVSVVSGLRSHQLWPYVRALTDGTDLASLPMV